MSKAARLGAGLSVSVVRGSDGPSFEALVNTRLGASDNRDTPASPQPQPRCLAHVLPSVNIRSRANPV